LYRLAQLSGVKIVACTGFHLRKYYPRFAWLWQLDSQKACDFFVKELKVGLAETLDQEGEIIKAGFIKVAFEDSLKKTPPESLEGAIHASLETSVAIEAHTEKGVNVEAIVDYFGTQGIPFDRLVICHIDKRPDFGLHRSIAQAGILLEYDTFYRPKYDLQKNLWPLLSQMIEVGFGSSICLATDMAESALWARYGGNPGLNGYLNQIKPD